MLSSPKALELYYFPAGGIWNLEAEELLKDMQQSLCAIGSSFQSLNAHRERHSKGCLAREFSSLVDSDYDKGVSLFLFALNLAQKI